MQIETVELKSLKTHPKNARRRSNVDDLKKSLLVNSQYKPLIVNKRNNYIVAGNHTFQAMEALGWRECHVVFLDLSEAEELRILAVDNRSSDVGFYDIDALDELQRQLEAMGALEGSGFERTIDDSDFFEDVEDFSEQISREVVAKIAELEKEDVTLHITVKKEIAERYSEYMAAGGDPNLLLEAGLEQNPGIYKKYQDKDQG